MSSPIESRLHDMLTLTGSRVQLLPRLTARLIDGVLLAGTGLVVGSVTGFGPSWFAFQLVMVAGYVVGFDVLTGATLGKQMMGLRIVAIEGHRRLTVAEAARREAFVVLGAIPFAGPVLAGVGWSAVAWSIHSSDDGDGLHDRFAGTHVVSRRTSS